MKVASQRFSQEPVLGLFDLFYLNGCRTLKGPHASVDSQRLSLYILNYCKQI